MFELLQLHEPIRAQQKNTDPVLPSVRTALVPPCRRGSVQHVSARQLLCITARIAAALLAVTGRHKPFHSSVPAQTLS